MSTPYKSPNVNLTKYTKDELLSLSNSRYLVRFLPVEGWAYPSFLRKGAYYRLHTLDASKPSIAYIFREKEKTYSQIWTKHFKLIRELL